MPMATPPTKTKPDGFVFPRLIVWLALVPAIFCLYLAFTYAMVRIGMLQPVENRDNPWLERAAEWAPFSPHAQSALARYNREWALQTSGDESAAYFERSRVLWDKAIALRPGWPFYELGALDAEMLAGVDAGLVQQRFQRLITMAPNERAMDERLLSLAFSGWSLLSAEQQKWVWRRLLDTPAKALSASLKIADQAGLKPLVCMKGPWVRIKSFCAEPGKRRKSDADVDILKF